MIQTTKNI